MQTYIIWLFVVVLLFFSAWKLRLAWRRVESELAAEAPSGGRAFLTLFTAAILFLAALLVVTMLFAPQIAYQWGHSAVGSEKLAIGELLNQYATALSLVFSVPTALAGSVVAILLALRALRSADDVRELTSQQTRLMQEQRALQESQIALEKAQFFNENRQHLADDVGELHRLYFELCDALTDYLATTRRVAFSFWEASDSGVSQTSQISLVSDDQFQEFAKSKERLWRAMKAIASSSAGLGLWQYVAGASKAHLTSYLYEEMAMESNDKGVSCSIVDLPHLIYIGSVYSHAASPNTLNQLIHEVLMGAVTLEHIQRSSFEVSTSANLIMAMGQSIFRSDGKKYPLELERLERLLENSWEAHGDSSNGSYLRRVLMDKLEQLTPETWASLADLLAKELCFVPDSLSNFKAHLNNLGAKINAVVGFDGVVVEDWYEEVENGAMSAWSNLEPEHRARAYILGSGALLTHYDGFDFHNIGAAIFVDLVSMLPDRQTLLKFFECAYGPERGELLDKFVQNGAINLDIQGFLPKEVRDAASWLLRHPTIALIAPLGFTKNSLFDKLFSEESWVNAPGSGNRLEFLRELGLAVGGYQQ